MEIKENSLIGWWYNLVYDKLPYDLCTLFWNTLWSILFLPFILPCISILRWVNFKIREPLFIKILVGLVFYLLIFFLIIVGYKTLSLIGWITENETRDIYLLYCFLAGLITIIVLIVLICLIVYLSILSSSKTTEIATYITASIRDKYCTKINWTKDN